MNGIIELRETSPNHWRAKYQGNYGVYTIKITTDGKRRLSFSCSCPSDYYPCKHIDMVEEAIAERIAKNTASPKAGKDISAGELLKKLTHEELYDFTARIVKNNLDLSNAVLLEFSDKIETKNKNKYAPIIRRGLADVNFDAEDYYYHEFAQDIDILAQWFDKARQRLTEKKVREAVLIAQACIEEYAQWLEEQDSDIGDYICEDYQSAPFEILKQAAAHPEINARDIYVYCMSEMPKEKYAGTMMFDGFNDLLMKVSAKVDPEAFIALQYTLLEKVEDKSSYAAQKILQRIIDFYKTRHQPQKAWQCIEENIQIDSFRKIVVEKRIKQKDFAGAKKLIRDHIGQKERTTSYPDCWDDYLLQIAQKEKDTPVIRSIAYSFIEDHFEDSYYRIYKSAFSAAEWAEESEKLFRHYRCKTNFYENPAADLLAAEGSAEKLIDYIAECLSPDNMEKYHKFFAPAFPERTLDMFRKAIDRYAEKNTGRSCYERIRELFRQMEKIRGGAAVTADMKNNYRIKYKNRPAMMGTLNLKG
ncbi:MAG: hypothetical protein LBQ57_11105 [Spirochaetales bacterium]|jgi:hypothetical protein|nr:hypothetical protein [Spirochaetales bacterium]